MGDIRRPGRNPRQGVTAKVIKRNNARPARGGGSAEAWPGGRPRPRKPSRRRRGR